MSYRINTRASTQEVITFLQCWVLLSVAAIFSTFVLNIIILTTWIRPQPHYLSNRDCYDTVTVVCDAEEMARLLGDLSIWPMLLTAGGLGSLAAWLLSRFLPGSADDDHQGRFDSTVYRNGFAILCGILVAVMVGYAMYNWFVAPATLAGTNAFLPLVEQRQRVALSFYVVFVPLFPFFWVHYLTLWSAGYPRHGWVPLSICGGLVLVIALVMTYEIGLLLFREAINPISILLVVPVILLGLFPALAQMPLLRGIPIQPWLWVTLSTLLGPLLVLSLIPLLQIVFGLIYALLIPFLIYRLTPREKQAATRQRILVSQEYDDEPASVPLQRGFLYAIIPFLFVGMLLCVLVGSSIGNSQRNLQQMIGVPLPSSARAITMDYTGGVGGFVIATLLQAEFEVSATFMMSRDEFPDFLQRIGCPLAEPLTATLDCGRYYSQNDGGVPENGTAELRDYHFEFTEPGMVKVIIELDAS